MTSFPAHICLKCRDQLYLGAGEGASTLGTVHSASIIGE